MDATLSGTDGSVTYDRGSDGVVIPGSYRNRHTAVNGSTVQLTLDDDIQFYVQQQVQQAKDASGANNLSAVVLDAKTGEVLAMSNDNTFDPSQDIGRQNNRQLGNLAVSSPFEPGSVNKIITASSVIEFGLSNPDEVLQVPGSINMVADADAALALLRAELRPGDVVLVKASNAAGLGKLAEALVAS